MNKYKKNAIIIGISILLTFAITSAIHLFMKNAYKDIKTELSEDANYEEELNAILRNKSKETLTLEEIDYEEYKHLKENKESFLLYIGRKTCPDCKMFDEILKNVQIESSMKYLSTQKYKDAISNDEPDAQKEYDDFKSNIGYDFIPYVCAVKEGVVISEFDFEFPENLSELTEEEKTTFSNDVCNRFIRWLVENQNIIQETSAVIDEEACPIDERCE